MVFFFVDDIDVVVDLFFDNIYSSRLQCDPSRHPVMLIVPNNFADDDMKKSLSLMFNTFHVPLVAIYREWELICRALSLKTCLIIIIGDSQTSLLPVHGQLLQYAASQIPIAGSHITDQLIFLLTEVGIGPFESQSDRSIAKRIKETYATVEPQKDSHSEEFISYTMPDGTQENIPLSALHSCGEVLFKPSLIGLEDETFSLPRQVVNAIKKSPQGVQGDLANNIVLVGGTAKLRGLKERLIREITELSDIAPRIMYPSEQKNITPPEELSWLGGSKLALSNSGEWFKKIQ
eukprot:TRINITY_DN4832_c0_g1_i1.p1 TRINITY_DN4832_c0_g1~~TRINITY_DN4832_c0_g1_i1.p1  ORF type:complete len:291 (-),score=53.01 TRINITY_DN4832_c0_g1_i1:112-984(-)